MEISVEDFGILGNHLGHWDNDLFIYFSVRVKLGFVVKYIDYCRLRTTYYIGQIVYHFHFKHAIIIRRPFCFVMLLFGFSIDLYLNLFAIFVISKQTVIFSFFTFIVFFFFFFFYVVDIFVRFFFLFLEKFSYNNIL